MVYMMIVNFLIWEPEISLFAFRLSLFAFFLNKYPTYELYHRQALCNDP